MGKISASTAQASWYSTTATVGSDAMPPASDMITAITQLISTDAVSTTPARYSPSAAPAAAGPPPTKQRKQARFPQFPKDYRTHAVGGARAWRSSSLSTFTEPDGSP